MPLTAGQLRSKYFQLYTNSKRLAWDPAAVDLSLDRESWESIKRDYPTERYAEQILRLCALFHAGEESVTHTLAPYLAAVARGGYGLDIEMFLTSQIYEEARHFEFFARYVREVFQDDAVAMDAYLDGAPRAVLLDDLDAISDRLRRENDLDALRPLLVEGVTHYMGVVEAMLARTGYVGAHDSLAARGWLPGLQEGFRLIRRDEGRHVAFGIHFIAEQCAANPAFATIVQDTFERHMPNVLGTIQTFQYSHPIVDLDKLMGYAMAASQQFMAAAGLADAPSDDELVRELEDVA